jgi:hypothetical protein
VDSESPANIKVEDVDDTQKERRRLINTKRANRRHRVVKTNQKGSGNLYDSSMGDSAQSSTLVGKPTAPLTMNSLSTTWTQLESASQKLGNNPSIERRLLVQRNDSWKPSTGNAHGTRRASIPHLNFKPFGGPWELH